MKQFWVGRDYNKPIFTRKVNIELEYFIGVSVWDGGVTRLDKFHLEIEGLLVLLIGGAKEEDIPKDTGADGALMNMEMWVVAWC